jgi:hypothetical protein
MEAVVGGAWEWRRCVLELQWLLVPPPPAGVDWIACHPDFENEEQY